MFEGMGIETWLPVFVVIGVFGVAGVAFAVASVRSGQYRDPEAAKYAVAESDEYPGEEPAAGREP